MAPNGRAAVSFLSLHNISFEQKQPKHSAKKHPTKFMTENSQALPDSRQQEVDSFLVSQLEKLPFIVHGSQDSHDKDIIYYMSLDTNAVQEAPLNGYIVHALNRLLLLNNNYAGESINSSARSTKILYEFCSKHGEDNNENRNLICIDENECIVLDCFKGTPDAIQNQILYTWNLHKQSSEACPLKCMAERNIVLKVARSIRHLLGSIGTICHHEKDPSSVLRTEIRPKVRQALRSLDFEQRIQCLSTVDFVTVFQPKTVRQMKDYEYISLVKSVVFQLVQTMAQFEYVEVYSKQTAVQFEVKSKRFVYREWLEDDITIEQAILELDLLNEYRDRIVAQCIGVLVEKVNKQLNNFLLANESSSSNSANGFIRQSNGHIVDMAHERCILFPIDIAFTDFAGMSKAMRAYQQQMTLEGIATNDVESSFNLHQILNDLRMVIFSTNVNPIDGTITLKVSQSSQHNSSENKKEELETQLSVLMQTIRHDPLYHWSRFYYTFAYNCETKSLNCIARRCKHSFRVHFSSHIDDAKKVENMDEITPGVSYLCHGRLFYHFNNMIV